MVNATASIQITRSRLLAIVFSIGLRLIDIKGLQAIFKTHREEFYLEIVTAATVVFIGVKEGIILAVMLSLILHVRHSYRPHSAIVIPDEKRLWQAIPVQMGSVSAPELIIYRFSRDLFYANTTFLSEEIEGLVKSASPPIRWLILEARGEQDRGCRFSSIALANDLTLVTHNTREFSRVQGLKLEDWEN